LPAEPLPPLAPPEVSLPDPHAVAAPPSLVIGELRVDVAAMPRPAQPTAAPAHPPRQPHTRTAPARVPSQLRFGLGQV
jgi:hypothetical protein